MSFPWAWLLFVSMAFAASESQTATRSQNPADGGGDAVVGDRLQNGAAGDGDALPTAIGGAGSCPRQCKCLVKGDRGRPAFVTTTMVNCTGQGLMAWPSGVSEETQVLDLSHNKLQTMEGLTGAPRLTRLTSLDMSHNWMRHLDNDWLFEHVGLLEDLSLADNGLHIVRHGSFNGLSRLRSLDLSSNIIRIIEMHAFAGLANLQVLHLDNNQLFHLEREWFLGLTHLTSLYLGDNRISSLEDNMFDRLVHLQHLDLSNNGLRLVPGTTLTGLVSLRVLNLSGNTRLKEVPTFTSSRGQDVHIAGGQSDEDYVSGAYVVKSGNSSSSGSPDIRAYFPKLSILLLDGISTDRLSTNAVNGFGVSEMSLSFLPKLRVVDRWAFWDLHQLHTLQLHDNPQLVFLHPEAFKGLPHLTHLHLHNNALMAISAQMVESLPSLADLQLHHNPLHCDCNIYWLRKALGPTQHHHHLRQENSNNDLYPSNVSSENTSLAISTTNNDTLEFPWHNITGTDGARQPDRSFNTTDKRTSTRKIPISEPNRVACYFPTGGAPIPLQQLPFQYFPPTCPPVSIPLFSANLNLSLDEELWLECYGLGMPPPSISWILPGGAEINLTNPSSPGSTAQVMGESRLHIKDLTLEDSGPYGCRVSNEMGDDFSSTIVFVKNKPLRLSKADIRGDRITVSWQGSVPRTSMSQFQLVYKTLTPETLIDGDVFPYESTDEQLGGTPIESGYRVIFLHGSIHKCTITGLKPLTTYEVCILYQREHPVHCQNYTTSAHTDAHTSQSGIVRVSGTQLLVAVMCVLGGLLVIVSLILLRKLRPRKDYRDPLEEEEKTAIPLQGLAPNVLGTPLTSSRTALLTNSQA